MSRELKRFARSGYERKKQKAFYGRGARQSNHDGYCTQDFDTEEDDDVEEGKFTCDLDEDAGGK